MLEGWDNSSVQPTIFHIAFYQFCRVSDPEACAARLREIAAPLLGSILVAHEGINGMLAGAAEQLDAFERAMQASVEEDPILAGAFTQMVFKRTACVTPPFKRLKVHVKREIVPLGIPDVDAAGRIDEVRATQVSPKDWRELIRRPDVVLVDNRNSFEYQLGHFAGAIDPGVENFRNFPAYVKAHAERWKTEGKTVAMYCTGGIRCEKSSVWMQDLGLKVAQLQGGILNYFKEMPDAEKDWQGECFVFDNRIALNTRLQETDTSLEDVYVPAKTDRSRVSDKNAWRLARAKRLQDSE